MSGNNDDDDDDKNDNNGAIDVLVPAAFAVTLPRRDDDVRPTSNDPWRTLRRKRVVVRANGFTVRGRLEGVDDDDVYLRGELRWFVLPMSTVTSVVRDDEADDADDADDTDMDDQCS